MIRSAGSDEGGDFVTGAALAGATPVNVGFAQGLMIGDHNTLNLRVIEHTEFVPRESLPLPPYWIERSSLLARVAEAVTQTRSVALLGMGGAGKSTLASRLVLEAAREFEGGCFWINLAAENAEEALARIALTFGHDISALGSVAARAQTVRSLLAERRVLLVFDDVWNAESVEAFLPPPAGCAALMITVNDGLATRLAAEVIEVDPLENNDAVLLLTRLFGASAAQPGMEALAEALGGLPLALELAGKLASKQARRPGFSWNNFAATFSTGEQRLRLGLAGASVRAVFDLTWTRALESANQRAFALLGLFEPGNISTAEAATVWQANDRAALEMLNELADLSLLRFVDIVTVALHPLLADYAQEKVQEISEEERKAAHQRVADYLFEHAPRPPRSLADLRYVLRSHVHSAAALDGDRVRRVYPWFGEAGSQTSVPGFLIDRGQFSTRVKHMRLELEMAQDFSPYFRSWALYWLAEALRDADMMLEASGRIHEALAIMESPLVSEDGRSIGLSKFLMLAGQIDSDLGDGVSAEAAYRRAVSFDRELENGGHVIGALSGALTGLLQLGDLLLSRESNEGDARATNIFVDVLEEAKTRGEAKIAVMAADRLARFNQQIHPVYALQCVREARSISEKNADAFEGRQGSRYARQLAETAVSLTYNGYDGLDDALALFVESIRMAGEADAQQELATTLYHLGNFFEHFHILDREAPLAAAWSAYALANRFTEETEGAILNAAKRIETRIVPRLDPEMRASTAAEVGRNPWGLIEAAIAPLTLGWRPYAT